MFLKGALRLLTSLKLTVVCLGLGIILVFIGTLAQVNMGIYAAQEKYFDALFVYWQSADGQWKIPIFPGGYLIGGILFINLVSAHAYRFRWGWKKSGIFLTHMGVLLLLGGGFLTSLLSVESQMTIDEGMSKNYSENLRSIELAIVDTSAPDYDKVVAIPEHILARKGTIQHPHLPFRLDIHQFYPNSKFIPQQNQESSNGLLATKGAGVNVTVTELPRVTQPNQGDTTSAVVEIITPENSLGIWLVTNILKEPQTFSYQNKNWAIEIRQERYYKPYSIHLKDFAHDKYEGTDIPKNFSSSIRLINPSRNEDRDALIYMNHPLRYDGETYYQASFANNDRTSILQVVRNPSWLTPYFACSLVALGLIVQFSIHLTSFIKQQRI